MVDDEISPELTITMPSAYAYYHGAMQVEGILTDSSSKPGDGQGRVQVFSFSVSDASLLTFTVTFDADGHPSVSTTDPSFDPSFTWDPGTGTFSFEVPTDTLQGYKVFSFTTADTNQNEGRRDLALLPYPYGPHLVLSSPEDNSSYDMVVEIEGTVTDTAADSTTDELRVLTWETNIGRSGELVIGPATRQADGTYLAGSFSFDPVTGAFSDWFDSSEEKNEIRVTVSAQNASSVWSSAIVYLDYNGTGPAISLFPLVGGHNPTWYSSDVAAASPSGTPIVVDGIVDITNLKSGSTVYWVYQNPGSPQTGSITPDMFGSFSFTFYPGGYPSGEPELSGNLTIQVKAKDNRDIESTTSYICNDDTTPPLAPAVSGPLSPTNDTTPTWTWTTPATTEDFQYSLVGPTGPWTVTTDTSYTLDPPLANGSRTLWARARDALGNCSSAGSYSLIVDTVPPAAPTVNAQASPTNDDTPTWSWNTPTGIVVFQYSLNAPAGPWTNTTGNSWTASPALVPADPYTDYTLFVQGRDAAGNWSASGSDTVRVDTTSPDAPTVSGPASPTAESRPTWTWTASVDATTCRRSLDDPDPSTWTTDNDFIYRPGSALTEGEHILYVQGRDEAGNWSASGFFSVIIEVP